MRTRLITITAIALTGLVLFMVAILLTEWKIDDHTDRWISTCSKLDAEVFQGPAGYACVRDGEVVYPR